MDRLSDRMHVIALDYPGFGYSASPASSNDGGDFTYTFDHLADMTEAFLTALGVNRFFMYVFDFGAPVGYRIASRRPDQILGVAAQNGNAYEVGLGPNMQPARQYWAGRTGLEDAIREVLTLEATRGRTPSPSSSRTSLHATRDNLWCPVRRTGLTLKREKTTVSDRQRMSVHDVDPEAYKPMIAMEKYIHAGTLGELLLALVKIRASQINGCAWCLDMHYKEARKEQVPQRKLDVIAGWSEAPTVYSERERAALALTEEVTLISVAGVSDAVWSKVTDAFQEKEIVQLLMAISAINVWNRLAVSTHQELPAE